MQSAAPAVKHYKFVRQLEVAAFGGQSCNRSPAPRAPLQRSPHSMHLERHDISGHQIASMQSVRNLKPGLVAAAIFVVADRGPSTARENCWRRSRTRFETEKGLAREEPVIRSHC